MMRPQANGAELTQGMAKDAKDKGSTDHDLIRELAALLQETGLSEIEIEREGMRVRVARPIAGDSAALATPKGQPAASRTEPTPKWPPDDPSQHPGCVPSPMVGIAYLAPEPGAAPFVEVGMRIAQGQTLLIIEAMKHMNHIPAPKAGTVMAVLVGNGQPVEFGEPLAIIE
jgi:acetyl-CoA carboxylase biotin carboxyl carrier protein